MLPGSGTASGKPAPTIVSAEAQLSSGCHGCLRDPPVLGPLWGSGRSHASMPQSVLLRMCLRVAHRNTCVILTRCYCAQSICDHMHMFESLRTSDSLWALRRHRTAVGKRAHSSPTFEHPPAHPCVGAWGSCYCQCTCGPLPSSVE